MSVPASVIAAGWIPFVVVLMLTFLFSSVYIRYYQSHYDSEISSTITTILGLTFTLLTAMLLPVDIFMVSFMKDSNGTFKNWAEDNATRNYIENAVLYGYYSLYIIVIVFAFMIIPFMYFFYEENDDDISTKRRLCTAVKYTLGFLFIAATLLLVGAFVPLQAVPKKNATEWQQLAYLFKEIGSKPQESFTFLLDVLILIGTLATITYTAYGMAAWPVGLIKGSKSKIKQHGELNDHKFEIQAKIKCIRDKYRDRRPMISKDRELVQDLEEKERILDRRNKEIESLSIHWENCCRILRPFQIFIGVFFLLFTLIIVTSLLLTNIDRAMYSEGYSTGYTIAKTTLPNPLSYILIFSQKIFPLDYIIIIGIVLYIVLSSMSAIKQMGIWFLWIKMYKIRSHRTRPQALLLMCMIVMFIILSLNTFMYSIVPQYTLYGSQHYWDYGNETSFKLCNIGASSEDCVITRLGMMLLSLFFRAAFFGATNYWLSWVFLLVFLIGMVVAVVKKRRSVLDHAFDSDSEDEFMIGT